MSPSSKARDPSGAGSERGALPKDTPIIAGGVCFDLASIPKDLKDVCEFLEHGPKMFKHCETTPYCMKYTKSVLETMFLHKRSTVYAFFD